MDPNKAFANTLIIVTIVLSAIIGIVAGGGLNFIRNAIGGGIGASEQAVAGQNPLVPTPTTVGLPSATVIPPSPTRGPTETLRATRTPTPEPTLTPSRTPQPTATPPAPPTSIVTPEPIFLTVIVEGRLTLRTAPDTEADVVTFLNKGTQGIVVGRDSAGEWVEIEVVGSTLRGWTSASPTYVTLSGDISDLPVTEP